MTRPVDLVDIFKALVRLDTTNPPGNEVIATDYLASLLADHGIGSEIVEPEPTRASIVARIGPERGKPPIVLISHLDVVAADPREWTHPPFDAAERDGIIYGRGTLDTKYLTAIELGALLALRDDELDRPVFFVATADEEQGSSLGMPVVAERWSDAFAGGTVVNEGGGFYVEHPAGPFHLCTAGEKGRCRFTVTLRGAPGPASFPAADPAMPKLMALLERMAACEFAPESNAVSERYDELLDGSWEHPFLRAFREYNRRDTFILKRFDAGSQANVLPHEITFEAEFQLLPARDRAYAEAVLAEVFHGLDAEWEVVEFRPGFVSDLDGEAFASLERGAREHLDGARLLPGFALGQTDGRFLGALGCDVYGFGPVTRAVPFSEVLTLVHQTDERISRESIAVGTAILERLIRDLGKVPA
ncbi:MAG: M20/M25/M40 family metallo-hydrolase [Spirochaetota bacterium]